MMHEAGTGCDATIVLFARHPRRTHGGGREHGVYEHTNKPREKRRIYAHDGTAFHAEGPSNCRAQVTRTRAHEVYFQLVEQEAKCYRFAR